MKKEEYAKWIKQVRGKLTQEDFGSRVIHYVSRNGVNVCESFHRNQVRNWEIGESIPNIKNLETFLSIALIDYDKKHLSLWRHCDNFAIDTCTCADLEACRKCPKIEQCLQERNQRCEYVQEAVYDMLGLGLYCRNLHCALLMQVCRGILTFEQVLSWEEELEALVQEEGSKIAYSEKIEIACERRTENLHDDWNKVLSKEEIYPIVQKEIVSFCTADRTLGERIKRLYESRQRYKVPLSLTDAIAIYAPNYRSTFGQRSLHRAGISREWLLDFCIHLRFSREEIGQVLAWACMVPLSDDRMEAEGLLLENENGAIGSGEWYRSIEKGLDSKHICIEDGWLPHYEEVRKWSLQEKLSALLLMAAYIRDADEENELLPPIDYLLESFTRYHSKKRQGRGDDIQEQLEKLINKSSKEEFDDDLLEDLQEKLDKAIKNWIDYINNGLSYAVERDLLLAYGDYKQECATYYEIPAKNREKIDHIQKATQLRFLAGLCYTVFTGRYYTGVVTAQDYDRIIACFQTKDAGELEEELSNLVTAFVGTFLDDNVLYEKVDRAGNVGFYIYDQEGIIPMLFTYDEMIYDLWQGLFELKKSECTM